MIEKQLAKAIRDLPDSTLCEMALKFGFTVKLQKPNGAAAKPRKPKAAKPAGEQPVKDAADHPKWKVLAFLQKDNMAGFSSSEIASALELKPSTVSACLKSLKADEKVFQGGDRRFARYASTQDAANAASLAARGG